MLDLVKVAAQVNALSQHLSQEASIQQRRIQQAISAFQQAVAHPQLWQDRHTQWQSRLLFQPALPLEAWDSHHPETWPQIRPHLGHHTVVSTDGSQIAPNQHEIAYCSLINIGRVAIEYGSQQRPLIDSVPVVFYRPADLGRAVGLDIEAILGLRRSQLEMEELTRLALQSQPDPSAPVLALVDGSLIQWGVDPMPHELQMEWLQPWLTCCEQLRQARIPLVGYISASRSSEVMSYLRLGLCPFEGNDCLHHCAGQRQSLPCQPFHPLNDRQFWAALLQPGQRSPLWRSGSRILQHYGAHHVVSCYLHVGEEIARLEMPAWVAEDPVLLESALEMVMSQVQKGLGYPVTLAEAHHLAVVRGGDRQRFYALLERALVRAGLQQVGVSVKEARKRGGVA